MKKTVLIVALATIMVLAFAGTAFAKGYSPGNRSSAFLEKGESYISWDTAKAQMVKAGLASDPTTTTVHGSYTTTTVKCQVCHSAHKASVTGDTLLQSTAAQACVPCHLGATATSALKVSAGNRHGGTTQCTNGYCHSIAPHGAGDISVYATLKSAMLTDHADELLNAAIAAGNGAPVAGNIYAAGADKTTAVPLATIAVKNAGVTATLLNDVSTPASIALGRAVGTGYVCQNGGCHINGQFNSLEPTATLGTWNGNIVVDEPGYSVTLSDSTVATLPAGTYTSVDTFMGELVWDLLHMRKAAIKGHTLAAVADLGVRNVAFANVGTCKSCHDSIDYRISATAKQFPHGNNRILSDGTVAGVSEAWFMAGAYLGSPDTTITTNSTTAAVRSGSDGACLKCHRNATNGVGIDF
ncbi:MAG: hypothetical protein ACYC6C_03410 [Coriobacteriia bacterium]